MPGRDYKADIADKQFNPLPICIKKLERVIECKIFQEAVNICLEKENRSDKIMSERLCEFIEEFPARIKLNRRQRKIGVL